MDKNELNRNKALEGIENILFDDADETQYNLYIVSYDEVFSGTEITKKEHYNLFVFGEKQEAIKYMRAAHRLITTPYLATGKFKEMFSTKWEDMLPEAESNIVYKMCTKMSGAKEVNKTQTRFFTFRVERVNGKLNLI